MAWLFAVCEHAEYPTVAGPCHPCILYSKRSAVDGQCVQRKWTNACQSSVAKVLLPYEQHWVTCLQSLRTHKYTPPCSEKMPAGLACCAKKSFISNEKLRLKYTRFEFNLNSYKTDFQQGSRIGGGETPNIAYTSINVTEVPFLVMQVPGNKLLCWWLLWVILQVQKHNNKHVLLLLFMALEDITINLAG